MRLEINREKKTSSFDYLNRVWVVFFFFLLCFLVITFRIVWLTWAGLNFEVKDFEGKVTRRGKIVDVKEKTLAFSEARYNLYFDGRKPLIAGEREQIEDLIGSAKLNHKSIQDSLRMRKVILLKRFANKSLMSEFQNFHSERILIERVEQRFYPQEKVLAQTIGFVGYDGDGLAGLELRYNSNLNSPLDLFREKRLVININSTLQGLLEQKLALRIKKNRAKTGIILIQEVKTGRLVSMVQYPIFNLNEFTKQKQQTFRNLAVNSLIEPGSVFKIFFIAYLIDHYGYDVRKKKYNCRGFYRLSNGEVIKDQAVHGEVSLQDIVKYSCNAGLIYFTEQLSREEMYQFLKRFKIGEKVGIDLMGESKGILPPLKEWGLRTKATIPIGQGIALTPLNLINSFTSLIGRGYLFSPKIAKSIEVHEIDRIIERKEIEPKLLSKVITDQTSRKVIDLLIHGTIKGSTGYASRKTGFDKVFGKTGTSQLVNLEKGGYYTDRYHSIFAGGYPSRDPVFSILVVISEPKKEYYGGKVAAPIFAEVVEELIRVYQLPEERIIEKYQNSFIEGSKYDEVVIENFLDRIPDFRGLSFKRSLQLAEDFKKIQRSKGRKVGYKIEGSGYVVKQTPPPLDQVVQDVFIKLKLK